MNYFQKKKLAFMSIVNRVKGFIRTITGALPLTLENCVDEESIIDYTLYGQSVQNGTPMPDTPIEVESVGEKTTNLINWDLLLEKSNITKVEDGYYSKLYEFQFLSDSEIVKRLKTVLKPDVTYTLSRVCVPASNINGTAVGRIVISSGNTALVTCPCWGGLKSITFTLTQEQIDSITSVFIYFYGKGVTLSNLQLTESDAVLSYEPYGYKIPIKVSGNGKTVTTNIYLDEPLRKVGDYADYIDFENGKVVRNVEKYTFTGKETDQGGATNDPDSFGYVVKLSSLSLSNKKAGLCNCLRQGVVASSGTNRFAYHNIANHPFVYVFFKKTDFPELGTYSPSTAKQVVKEMYDSGVPMVLYYNRNTPTETSITLPNLPTFKGTNIISADTTVQPSNAEIEYYSNVKE